MAEDIPNTLVFSILDCCRVRREAKGDVNTSVRELGQLYIAFGSKAGKPALSDLEEGVEGSRYTNDFVKKVKEDRALNLPIDILQWRGKVNRYSDQ